MQGEAKEGRTTFPKLKFDRSIISVKPFLIGRLKPNSYPEENINNIEIKSVVSFMTMVNKIEVNKNTTHSEKENDNEEGTCYVTI